MTLLSPISYDYYIIKKIVLAKGYVHEKIATSLSSIHIEQIKENLRNAITKSENEAARQAVIEFAKKHPLAAVIPAGPYQKMVTLIPSYLWFTKEHQLQAM